MRWQEMKQVGHLIIFSEKLHWNQDVPMEFFTLGELACSGLKKPNKNIGEKYPPIISTPCCGHAHHGQTSLSSQAPFCSPAPSQLTSLWISHLLRVPHIPSHIWTNWGLSVGQQGCAWTTKASLLALPCLLSSMVSQRHPTSQRFRSKADFLALLPSFSVSADVSNVICSIAPGSGADWMWWKS